MVTDSRSKLQNARFFLALQARKAAKLAALKVRGVWAMFSQEDQQEMKAIVSKMVKTIVKNFCEALPNMIKNSTWKLGTQVETAL